MTTEHTTEIAQVQQGDCLTLMAAMPECSVDAIVTDPPYGLGFMGKVWDALPPGEEWARACLRVLKPGGHMLAFGGSRTWHRLAVAIEDAEFELRDSIAWMYGSGFPKSMDVSKAIDKAAGAERRLTRPGVVKRGGLGEDWDMGSSADRPRYDEAATPEAAAWQGWGTALKPAFEPIVVARKPFAGPVAANVLEHGTGALNIDGCRVAASARPLRERNLNGARQNVYEGGPLQGSRAAGTTEVGRWPANVVLDESQAAALDEQTGTSRSRVGKPRGSAKPGDGWGMTATGAEYDDQGGASRFFYVAKAPTKERPVVDGVAHPTVKPLTLMRWLVRLVTPPGGVVLDPFAGSGTTLEAALLEGFTPLGIELCEEYVPLIRERLARVALVDPDLFGGVA